MYLLLLIKKKYSKNKTQSRFTNTAYTVTQNTTTTLSQILLMTIQSIQKLWLQPPVLRCLVILGVVGCLEVLNNNKSIKSRVREPLGNYNERNSSNL